MLVSVCPRGLTPLISPGPTLCYGHTVLTGCTALIEDESAHELCGVNAMLPIDYHRNMAVLCVRIRAGVAGHGGGVVASAARAWSARARAPPRLHARFSVLDVPSVS